MQELQKKLDLSSDLRPFPATIGRLIECVNSIDTSTDEMAKVIELDVALASKVLRLVNSPLFGVSQKINGVRHAINLLGRQRLKRLALTYAVSKVLRDGNQQSNRQRQSLWKHSIGCASVAKVLCNYVPDVVTDEAFMGGIFHDLGKLFLLDNVPQDYCSMFDTKSGTELVMEETDRFGMDHVSAGFALTATWPISDAIKSVVRYHHDPDADQVSNRLVRLVNLSDMVAHAYGVGSTRDDSVAAFDKAQEYFDICQYELDDVGEESQLVFQESLSALN